jgi:type VI secretion system protein ImpL
MFRPWALAGTGIAALAALIWFAGPLLVFGNQAPLASAQARALVIAVFALQYLAQKLWQRRRTQRANDELVSALASDRESGSTVEGARLAERFAGALSDLRRARFLRGGAWGRWMFWRPYLYQLPWYLIIGGSGSGKTTALLNSGLRFPLAEKHGHGAVRGSGATGHCDWWFTDQSVFIDVAGRYTTHERDRVQDRQAWGVFLELLRRTRPRHPLNGVLMAVSVPDLLDLSADGVVERAKILRARLDELHMALRVRLPVYFLLTKCDLLPGFVDWFGGLNRADRDQPWGVTFDLRASDSGQAAVEFATAFERLLERLADGLNGRLQSEPDPQRRGRILALPRQIRALSGSLDSLVRRAFGPARSGTSVPLPLLRGVYLTSGTQEGTPIDRTLSAFGRELGLSNQILPANATSGKSFFLARLLSEVVYAESNLSNRKPLRELTRSRLRLAGIVVVQLCAVALGAFWVADYLRTVDDLARLGAEVDRVAGLLNTLPSMGLDPRPLLPAIDAVDGLSGSLPAARLPAPLEVGSAARRKLRFAAREAYNRLLLGPFQTRIAGSIDASLRSGAEPDVQYEALKAYTMLTDPTHFDGGGFKVFVVSFWDGSLIPPLSPTEHANLVRHLDALIDAGAVGSGITIEPALVASVRNRLSEQSPSERIKLRLGVLFDTKAYPDFTVGELSPAAAELFVGADGRSPPRAVPGRYTLEAYREVVVPEVKRIASQLASEADWVLSSSASADASQIANALASYRTNYARAWSDLMDDLRLRPAASHREALDQARVLGEVNGPLALLLEQLVRQTSPQVAAPDEGPMPTNGPLAARFATLAPLANPAGGDPATLEKTLSLFREFATLDLSSNSGESSAGPQARFLAAAARVPEPVRTLLASLITAGPGTGSVDTHAGSSAALSQEIAARLGVTCIRLVAGRFPFDRASQRDAPLPEFTRLFGPKGSFDEVFERLIAPRVDITADAWVPRRVAGAPAPAELERFRAAARIRDAFFPQGSTLPAIRMVFRPLDLDARIDRFELQIDGQSVHYTHGPATPTTVTWPGAQAGVRIQVSPDPEGGSIEYQGPWALFRLMDHAAVQEVGSADHLRVVFDIGGRRASFDVQSEGEVNPFRFRELEHFDCPLGEH